MAKDSASATKARQRILQAKQRKEAEAAAATRESADGDTTDAGQKKPKSVWNPDRDKALVEAIALSAETNEGGKVLASDIVDTLKKLGIFEGQPVTELSVRHRLVVMRKAGLQIPLIRSSLERKSRAGYAPDVDSLQTLLADLPSSANAGDHAP